MSSAPRQAARQVSALTPEVYTQKRDELVGLLDECIDAIQKAGCGPAPVSDSALDDSCEDLKAIRRKLRENQFSIALVSKFQGGKSTTFNALNGGRPLSPMGSGISSTSATVCRAWNVEDPAKQGADVVWRSDRELVESVFDLVRERLVEQDEKRFAGSRYDRHDLNLAAPADAALFAAVVRAETDDYLKDRGAYTSKEIQSSRQPIQGSDKVALLFIASVIARYRDHHDIQKLKSRSGFSLEEAGSLVRFPTRFAEKQLDFLNGSEPFSPKELAFAFVREVNLRVPSPHLARLGVAVTDCPGLSASAYDSQITMDIVRESDAVWYLLDGNTAIGRFEGEDIRDIHKAVTDKMFFSVNLRSSIDPSRSHIENVIVPGMRQALEPLQVCEPLYSLHVLLAYLAMVGPDLLGGKADKATRDLLVNKAHDVNVAAKTAEEAWERVANKMLRLLAVPQYQEFAGLSSKLSAKGIGIIREASGWDVVLDQIEGFVIRNKGRTVLVDSGARRAIRVLDEAGETLADSIRVREEGVVKAREAYARQLEELEAFGETTNKAVGRLDFDKASRRLAEDFIDAVVLQAVPEAARIAAPGVARSQDYLRKTWQLAKSLAKGEIPKPLGNEIEAILQQALREASAPAREAWIRGVRSGTNGLFSAFLGEFGQCVADLDRTWQGSESGPSAVSALPSPVPDALRRGTSITPQALRSDLEALATPASGDMGSTLAGGLTGWALFGTIAFFTPGIGPIFTVVSAGVCAVLFRLVGTAHHNDEIRKAIETKLTEELKAKREDFVRSIASQQMAPMLGLYRDLLKQAQARQIKRLRQQEKSLIESQQRPKDQDAKRQIDALKDHAQSLDALRERLDEFCRGVPAPSSSAPQP
ncbi:MAG: hypothetical protein GX595_21170 [Lentisphaerae bacterium]|nr:hypothetical protein [Lentisphaerota bacterium]